MEYSVVIPARDAARTLPRVLDALAVQEPRPLEVIVVDDGSSDGTARIAEERGARVVSPGGRSFAGGARNAGWEQAHGDLVVFLDADVVPGPAWGAGIE
ncbi:MAG TPA: glycosyltransferase family A protein, partial [Gaiellaceae bacterium]|nr:glycosyltransferase family A protein [Gaiellaceae bacterium]